MLEVKGKGDDFLTKMSSTISKQDQIFNNKETNKHLQGADEIQDSSDEHHVFVDLDDQSEQAKEEILSPGQQQQQKPLASRLKNIVHALIAGKKGE